MNPQAIQVRVTGRVQGVFFRKSAQSTAKQLGLTGWVRNLENGDVEVIAEGPHDALEAFVRWCHHGPPAAKVDHVSVTPLAATGTFLDFSVRP